MKPPVYYAIVLEALAKLKEQGYTTDFKLAENVLTCNEGEFDAENFEITSVYRYEGDSNPDDESTVYAIESKSGIKGTLIASYGAYSDKISEKILQKLRIS